MAPGFTLYHRPISIGSGEELTIPLERGGGTLVLRFPSTAQEPGRFPRFRAIHGDGSIFDGSLLIRWASINDQPPRGGEITVPLLPPGGYEVCWRSLSEPMTHEETCRRGTLSPGEEWILELDEAQETNEGEKP